MANENEYNRVLAIDTATRMQSLALLDGDVVLARRLHRVKRDHSATLLRNVGDMLEQHGWSVSDLGLVAVGVGPGSFTGLRVGLANAKGLARAAGAAIVGVSSLAAIARPACYMHEGPVAAIMDARRKEVYAAVYEGRGADFRCVVEDHTTRPAALHERLEALAETQPLVVVGDGLRAYPELTQWPEDADVRALDAPWDAPSSVSIALLGRRHAREQGPHDLVQLEPNYIRPSDAELNA